MFSQNYKRRSGGVDKRAMRAHRMSVDRKQFREDELSKRRNLAVVLETTAIDRTMRKIEETKETDGSSIYVTYLLIICLCFFSHISWTSLSGAGSYYAATTNEPLSFSLLI